MPNTETKTETKHVATLYVAWNKHGNRVVSAVSCEFATSELRGTFEGGGAVYAAKFTLELPTWEQGSGPYEEDEEGNNAPRVLAERTRIDIDATTYQGSAGERCELELFHIAWSYWSGDVIEIGFGEDSEEAVADLESGLPDDRQALCEIRIAEVWFDVLLPGNDHSFDMAPVKVTI